MCAHLVVIVIILFATHTAHATHASHTASCLFSAGSSPTATTRGGKDKNRREEQKKGDEHGEKNRATGGQRNKIIVERLRRARLQQREGLCDDGKIEPSLSAAECIPFNDLFETTLSRHVLASRLAQGIINEVSVGNTFEYRSDTRSDNTNNKNTTMTTTERSASRRSCCGPLLLNKRTKEADALASIRARRVCMAVPEPSSSSCKSRPTHPKPASKVKSKLEPNFIALKQREGQLDSK